MGLNIKNESTCQAIRQLAKVKGTSLTQTVDTAVREGLARAEPDRSDDRFERMLAIARDCASRLKGPALTMDHGEYLYDEKGLPK